MAWDIQNSEVRGRTSVDIDGKGEQTLISVTVQVESVGVLSSMFFPVIATAIGRGLPRSVEAFAADLAG